MRMRVCADCGWFTLILLVYPDGCGTKHRCRTCNYKSTSRGGSGREAEGGGQEAGGSGGIFSFMFGEEHSPSHPSSSNQVNGEGWASWGPEEEDGGGGEGVEGEERDDYDTYSEPEVEDDSPSHRKPCYDFEIQEARCLNNGQCFAIELHNGMRRAGCRCTSKWTGERCEMRYVDPRYWADTEDNVKRAALNPALVVIILFSVLFVSAACLYIKYQKRRKGFGKKSSSSSSSSSSSCSSSMTSKDLKRLKSSDWSVSGTSVADQIFLLRDQPQLPLPTQNQPLLTLTQQQLLLLLTKPPPYLEKEPVPTELHSKDYQTTSCASPVISDFLGHSFTSKHCSDQQTPPSPALPPISTSPSLLISFPPYSSPELLPSPDPPPPESTPPLSARNVMYPSQPPTSTTESPSCPSLAPSPPPSITFLSAALPPPSITFSLSASTASASIPSKSFPSTVPTPPPKFNPLSFIPSNSTGNFFLTPLSSRSFLLVDESSLATDGKQMDSGSRIVTERTSSTGGANDSDSRPTTDTRTETATGSRIATASTDDTGTVTSNGTIIATGSTNDAETATEAGSRIPTESINDTGTVTGDGSACTNVTGITSTTEAGDTADTGSGTDSGNTTACGINKMAAGNRMADARELRMCLKLRCDKPLIACEADEDRHADDFRDNSQRATITRDTRNSPQASKADDVTKNIPQALSLLERNHCSDQASFPIQGSLRWLASDQSPCLITADQSISSSSSFKISLASSLSPRFSMLYSSPFSSYPPYSSRGSAPTSVTPYGSNACIEVIP